MMTPEEAKSLIDDLIGKINHYNDEYYNKGESSIDDDTYDILLNQLIELETRYPKYRRADSPSHRVGGAPTENFENVRHNHPMLSLSNLYSEEDLLDWIKSILNRLGRPDIRTVCEVKIDGIAISVIYTEGVFTRAVTRGDGEVGDDVTHNVKTIRSLPLTLGNPVTLETRGEIYLPKDRFDKLNEFRAKAGEVQFKNPRNAAAGTIRLKNSKLVSNRGLELLLYDIVAGRPSLLHSENLDFMEKLGLPVNPFRKTCSSKEEILEFCRQWQEGKHSLPFEIDGVVIKVESIEDRDLLGVTAKSPRWATAWKFKAEKAKSRLLGVEDSIGRTGILTPVANLEPVQLLGTEVKRATLHNYDQITRLGIHHKDTLFVEKGGDIIPKIVGVDYTERLPGSEPLEPPENCPVCHTLLKKEEGEVDLRCINRSCPAVIEGTLEHFVSKRGMDIQFLGSAVIRQLISKGLVSNIGDIYRLHHHRETLENMEGMGKKSVENLLSAIETSKKNPLNQLIHALGIRHIGEKAAKTIACQLDSLQDFLTLDRDRMEKLSDFGPIMIDSVLDWLHNEKNRSMLQELIELGVKPTPLSWGENQTFAGKSVVITGTLSMPRSIWKERLENLGFQVTSAVSKKTDYLLAGEKAGSKESKAKSMNIPILSEEEMTKLIQTKSS